MMIFSYQKFLITIFVMLWNTAKSENQIQREVPEGGLAFAYRCNENFVAIKSNDPIEAGAKIRICVETTDQAKLGDIFITKFSTFEILKDDEDLATVKQILIQNGDAKSDKTSIECEPASELCYFDTILSNDFFYSDGEVLLTGRLVMQSGKYRRNLLRGRRNALGIMSIITELATVNVKLKVEDGKPSDLMESFIGHWDNSPNDMKALYIAGLVVALLLVGWIFGGLIFWSRWCSHKSGSEKRIQIDDKVPKYSKPSKPSKPTDDDLTATNTVDDSTSIASTVMASNKKASNKSNYYNNPRRVD